MFWLAFGGKTELDIPTCISSLCVANIWDICMRKNTSIYMYIHHKKSHIHKSVIQPFSITTIYIIICKCSSYMYYSPWNVLLSHFCVRSSIAHRAFTVRSACVHRSLTVRSSFAHHSNGKVERFRDL